MGGGFTRQWAGTGTGLVTRFCSVKQGRFGHFKGGMTAGAKVERTGGTYSGQFALPLVS